MIALVSSLFTALANIKTLAGYIEQFACAVTLWYVNRQNAQTLSIIANAAARAAHAITDEDRYVAAKYWQDALSRPRIQP